MKNKFNVGDLVCFPEENNPLGDNDIGVIFRIDKHVEDGFHYHIHWAIDQKNTIEEAEWFHEAIELVACA